MLAQELDKRLKFLPYNLQFFFSKIKKRNSLRFSNSGFRPESLLSEYVNDNRLSNYVNNENYLKIFDNANSLPALQTEIDIQPSLLGAKPSQVSLKKGRPDSIYEEKDIKIFIYKWKSNNTNIRYTIHFYKNRAFFINCSFIAPNAAKRKFILDSVMQKYSVGNISNLDAGNRALKDKNENMIFIDETISEFKINYLNNKNASWFKGISDEMVMELNKQKAIKKLKEQWFNATI